MPLDIQYVDENLSSKEGNGFVFLDLDHPLVAWEVAKGSLISSKLDEYLKNIYRPSNWLANAIYTENYKRLINEIIFENIRIKEFPDKVSRLTGQFFLKDLDSVKHCLDWGGHFKLSNLSEVFYSTKSEITKCDANWITNASLDNNGIIKKSYIDSIRRYWSGEKDNRFPFATWEYLIDGLLTILNPEVRNNAVIRSLNNFPKSKKLLMISIAAPHFNLTTGHALPYISNIGEDKYRLTYIINVKKEEIEIILNDSENIARKLDIEFDEYEGMVTPDLTPYYKEFSISLRKNIEWEFEYVNPHFY